MNRSLTILARKMQRLKQEDKEDFLTRLKDCSILFNPERPSDIPGYPVEERLAYRIGLIRSLYRKLEGKEYKTYSSKAYYQANGEELKEMARIELRQEIVSNGVFAYCQASEQNRKSFEETVRKDRVLAPILRKKEQIGSHDSK